MRKWLFIFVLNLVACTTNQPVNGTAIDDMTVVMHQGMTQNEMIPEGSLKPNVSKVLVPDYKYRSPRNKNHQRRFDIAVKDVPANTFYMGLVAGTPASIIVSPEVKGNVTLNLKRVTVEEVLQVLEDVYHFAYKVTPGGYEIFPNSLQTQIYSVNYLELERVGSSDMKLSSGEVLQVAPQSGSAVSTPYFSNANNNVPTTLENTIGKVKTTSTFNFWKKLEKNLKNIVGKEGGRSVTVNPLAGVVVVRALTKEHKQVEAYLDLIQNHMDRQVVLEAKVLEVTLSNEFQMGIDWKIFGARLRALSDFPQVNIHQDEFPKAFRININWNKDFTTLIQALETQGNVQVLSSPRVATMNNQKALIKVGSDEFYVTSITQNNSYTNSVVNSQNIPNINWTPFFSGITLDVTPQIDQKGDVTLHIHPSVSLVTTQRKPVNLGEEFGGEIDFPMAHSTIRESDTVVHAKNGQVIIIGGLMQNQTVEDIAELPFFGNIPFLGTLVRATKQTSQKSELVILLKPTIVNKRNELAHLNETTQRLAGLKRGFHFGSRPDVFGNEGEEPIVAGPTAGFYSRDKNRRVATTTKKSRSRVVSTSKNVVYK